MTITDRIQSMYTHVENAYNSIEDISSDLGKNNLNIELAPSELEQTTYTGKNLFNTLNRFTLWKTTEVSKTNNELVLKPIETNAGFTSYEIPASANTQYTVSCDISMSGYTSNFKGQLWIYEYNADNTQHYITVINTDNLKRTFTTQNDTIKIRFNFYSTNDGNTGWENSQITYSNIQWELGNTKTSFEPYVGGTTSPNPEYPEEIHTINGDNTIVVSGKNLIGLGTSLNGYVDATAGSSTFMKMQTNSTSIGYYFETSQLPNTLTISDTGGNRMNVCYFNDIPANNVVATSRSASNDNPRTITVDKTYPYIHIQFSYREENVTNIQLESGSAATTYEPYVSQTAPINLPVENLFDKDTITTDTGWLIEDGTISTGHTGYYVSDYILVSPNTNYYRTKTGSTRAKCYDKNKQPLNTTSYQDISILGNAGTFTTPSNCYYIRMTINTSTTDLNTIQLEKGTKANSYTPYGITPIEYCKIGNYEDEFILTSGKNLLNINEMVLGDLDNSTGAEVSNTNKTHYRSGFIAVKPSTTYVFSTNYQVSGINKLMEYGSDKSFITRNSQSSTHKTIIFTTSANTYFFRLCMFTNPAFTDFYSLENMLEMSSSATSYEPYGTNEWYLKKNIGKVVLDGSENWYTNASTFRFSGFNGKPFTTFEEDNPLAYSNYFKWQNGKSNQFVYGSMWYTLDGTQFAVQKEATVTQATLADFKTWLSSNNLSVYYVLATPTYTPITGTLANQLEAIAQLQKYDEQTNISQINNDLPFIITTNINHYNIENISLYVDKANNNIKLILDNINGESI